MAKPPQFLLWAAPPSQAFAAGDVLVSLAPPAEQCLVNFRFTSTMSPRNLIKFLFPSWLTVGCNPGHAMVTGRAHGAASCSVSNDTSEQRSCASPSYAPWASKFCTMGFLLGSSAVPVSVSQDTPTVTAGLRAQTPRLSTQTCGTTQPENLHNTSPFAIPCSPSTQSLTARR